MAGAGVLLGIYGFLECKMLLRGVTLLWVIGPPAWFFVEFWLYQRVPQDDPNRRDFETFAHWQKLAGAVWAGVVVALVMFQEWR